MADKSVTTITNGSPDSPCVRNCCLNERNQCLGCGRSLAEILEWHKATESRRQDILSNAQRRLAQQVDA